MSKRIAIIGSGFLGLTLAMRFSEAGAKVTVFESASEIGGLASSWKIGDVVWDKHYHVTLLSDSFTRKLIKDIGLGDEFNWVETKTGFYFDGRLVSMSNAIEFLRFPALGLLGKIRLGATIFYAARIKNWKALEKISVSQWLTRLSGKKTFRKIWKPLLRAKLGDAYLDTSAAFIWATIQRMYAARNSGMKKEMFGYVRGGYARVLTRFAEVLDERGVIVRLNSSVKHIEKLAAGGFAIQTAGTSIGSGQNRTRVSELAGASSPVGRSATIPPLADVVAENAASEFDIVILTCPADIAARILPDLNDEDKQKLTGIRYQGIVCASVLLKRSLSPFYVTNIIEETPFTGIIEMSALVDKAEFGGNALVYLPKYVAPDDKLFEKTDDEIKEDFLNALDKMYPDFTRSDVLAFRISRVRQVFPLPVLNYSKRIPAQKSSIPGVFIVNSSHIVNGTLNVNETVQLAENFFKDFWTEGTA